MQALSDPRHPAHYFIHNEAPRKGLRPLEPPPHPAPSERRPAAPAQRRLRPAEVADLIAVYESGATIDELAAQFGCHRTTVMAHLDRSGVQRRQKGLTVDQLAEAISLYSKGWSLAQVGNYFLVSGETVRAALRRANVPIRARQGWNRIPGDR